MKATLRKSLCLGLLFSPIMTGFLALRPSKDALVILLWSSSLSERRSAYQEVFKNPNAYVDEIMQSLMQWQKIKDIRALDDLIYLAALLKRDEFVDPLIGIATDTKYRRQECIYDCPPELALAIYTISKPWASPHKLENHSIPETLDLSPYLKRASLSKGSPPIQFADAANQELLSKMEGLSEEALIERADPANEDSLTRWLATEVLSCRVVDAKHLSDFYWLALEEIGADALLSRAAIYQTILRAEKAKTEHRN